MDIAIGIPVYNARRTLERAIDSALSQTFRGKTQVIIVDDGSTDNSANIARAYALRFPDTVEFVRVNNGGVAAARNRILSMARARYITWLDSDDYYFPDKIEQQIDTIRALESYSPGRSMELIVFFDFIMNSKPFSFKPYFENPLIHVLNGNFRAYLWSSIARLQSYRKIGPFNEFLHRSEDTDWLLRFMLAGGCLCWGGDQPIMAYHFSNARDGRKVEESLIYMLNHYGGIMQDLGLDQEYIPRRWWEIANFYKANKNWDDMWRCRAMAAKLDFANYFPKIVQELMRDVKARGVELTTSEANMLASLGKDLEQC